MMFLLFQTFGKKTLHVATYNSQQIMNNESHTKMYERVNKLLLLLLFGEKRHYVPDMNNIKEHFSPSLTILCSTSPN